MGSRFSIVPTSKLFSLLSLLLFFTLFQVRAQDIFEIARKGTAKEMQRLLKKHPEQLQHRSEQGATPLLLATYRGNYEVAALLLELGADPNLCYKEGAAIYGVIFKADTSMLHLLISHGVDVNQPCQFQELGYPIHLAINLQRIDVLKQLITAGARLDVLDAQGRSISDLLRIYQNPQLNQLFQQYEK